MYTLLLANVLKYNSIIIKVYELELQSTFGLFSYIYSFLFPIWNLGRKQKNFRISHLGRMTLKLKLFRSRPLFLTSFQDIIWFLFSNIFYKEDHMDPKAAK